MRKIREVLRLRLEHAMTARDAAGSCGLGCTTVLEYSYRANAAGLVWPLPEGLTDGELEALLFPASSSTWCPIATSAARSY